MKQYPSFGVQGAYFFCSRTCFIKLNGFDEILDPYGLEESDLAFRGMQRGWKIIYAPDTKPRHKWGGTINSKKSRITQVLLRRNAILFVWKNIKSPVLLFCHFLWLLPSLLNPKKIEALAACIKKLPELRRRKTKKLENKNISEERLFNLSAAFEKKIKEENKKLIAKY